MAEAQAIRATSFDIRKVLVELTAEYGVVLDWRSSGPAHVDGDRYLLPVALSCAIENACKYGRSREGVLVDVQCWEEQGQNGKVVPYFVIDIHDDGPGIPQEERARVFEKYYRAPQGLYRSGSGLGLFLARSILDIHGGSIDVVDSSATPRPRGTEGSTGGSTVRLKLPGSRAVGQAKRAFRETTQ